MTERKVTWELLPIHPFTDRQAQIIQEKLKGKSNKQIAESLGISEGTVKNFIHGSNIGETRSGLGIFGIIEEATGKRPITDNWIASLIGDVVFPFEVYIDE